MIFFRKQPVFMLYLMEWVSPQLCSVLWSEPKMSNWGITIFFFMMGTYRRVHLWSKMPQTVNNNDMALRPPQGVHRAHFDQAYQGCPQVGAGGRNPLLPLSLAPPTFPQFNTFCAIFLLKSSLFRPLLLPMRPLLKKLRTTLAYKPCFIRAVPPHRFRMTLLK